MLARIKSFLDSTVFWIVFLVGCVAYFWRKEKDAEYKLEETKANDTIKDEKKAVTQADSASTSAEQHFEQLSRQYKQQHPDD